MGVYADGGVLQHIPDIQCFHLRDEPQLIPEVGQFCVKFRDLLRFRKGDGPAVHGLRIVHRVVVGDNMEVGLAVGPVVVAFPQGARFAGVLRKISADAGKMTLRRDGRRCPSKEKTGAFDGMR